MSSLGFYALGNAWLLALAAPLVLFYFLKLKRPRVQVPSLVLWRQVLEDRRMNFPFQRFKRNLLLLLQILLLLLLVTAALQPFWRGREARAERIPVLIDNSASMAALEEPGGRSRLEPARERVRQIIDGLLPDQQMCLIEFNATARRLTDFTDNKKVLREALEGIRTVDVPSQIEPALRMTAGLARTTSFGEVLLFTDGNLPERAHFDLPFDLNYQRLPAGGPNFGIIALNARRSAGGGWDVLALVEGSKDAGGAVSVEVFRDGAEMATRHVSPGPGGRERILFRIPGERKAEIEVRLSPDGFDSLQSDNVAYLRLGEMRPLQAYVPARLADYGHALNALDAVALSEQEGGSADAAYDLAITDGTTGSAPQAPVRLFVGVIPQELQDLVSLTREGSTVVDWDRAAPLLQHVELAELTVADRPTSLHGAIGSGFERLGYQVLVHGDAGPLLLRAEKGMALDYYLLFHTDRSTLPYRVAFPVLMANLAEIALERAGLAERRARKTGALAGIDVAPGRTYSIRSPRGQTWRREADAGGLLTGIPAPHVGYYELSAPGDPRRRVGAALLDASETSLAAVREIQFDEELAVSAAETELQTDRSIWQVFAIVAFCVLMVEWWYYQAGSGGVPNP